MKIVLVTLATFGLWISYLVYSTFGSTTPLVVIDHNNDDEIDSVSCFLGSIISIPLDSLTTPKTVTYVRMDSTSAGQIISFLNGETKVIYIHDWNSRRLLRTIPLATYGFGSDSKIQGYHILNLDSLLIYDYRGSVLSLISLDSGLLLKKTIKETRVFSNQAVYPFVTTASPIHYSKATNSVLLTGFLGDEGGSMAYDRKRTVLANFSLSDGSVNYSIAYPDFYWGVNWGGGGGLRQIFSALDDNKNNVLVSFMADPFLTKYDILTGREQKVYAGSRYVKTISSMPFTSNQFNLLEKSDIIEYYFKTPAFTSIMVDEYNCMYYRLVEHAVGQYNSWNLKENSKRKSLVILNQDMKKIGEILLPQGVHDFYNCFITDKGLFVKMSGGKDENNLSFQQFEILKK